MKMTKRIMAVLLAVFLLAALAVVPASAADIDTGVINITKATTGDTYKAYKILSVEDGANNAFRYVLVGDKATDGTWGKFVATNSGFVVDGIYADKSGTYAATAVGADAMAWITGAGNGVIAAPVSSTVVDASGNATITGLGYGLYLVLAVDDDGVTVRPVPALVSILPGKTTAAIQSKNADTIDGLPAAVKEVQEDSDLSWGDSNTADFNQVVKFKITLTADNNAKNYVLTDTLGAGFTMDDDAVNAIVVKENGAAIAKTTDYNVTFASNVLTITFVQTYLDTLVANDEITVEYSATLNTNAVVAGEGNKNSLELGYYDWDTSANATKTADPTTTYTYKATVTKKDEQGNMLAGAQFKFQNKITGKYALVDDGKLAGWDATGTTITTDGTGIFSISGLDADEYTLIETVAPAGYIKAADTAKSISNANIEFEVINITGTELPSTGGIGTTIFYVAGLVLVLAAVTVLVSKKRANA